MSARRPTNLQRELTARQREITAGVANGLTNGAIARRLKALALPRDGVKDDRGA
jgi:DNA-binding NarL/FixJ family response regulator